MLRGTKQRPDIREQSNPTAKAQSACKPRRSPYTAGRVRTGTGRTRPRPVIQRMASVRSSVCGLLYGLDPVVHRQLCKDMVRHMGGCPGHTPRFARRANHHCPAGEHNDEVVTAARASGTPEPSVQARYLRKSRSTSSETASFHASPARLSAAQASKFGPGYALQVLLHRLVVQRGFWFARTIGPGHSRAKPEGRHPGLSSTERLLCPREIPRAGGINSGVVGPWTARSHRAVFWATQSFTLSIAYFCSSAICRSRG